MTMARILVHLDTREGLEEKITLHWKHLSHRKNIDYEGVPSKCRRCHKVVHLYKDCPLIIHTIWLLRREQNITRQKIQLWMSNPQVQID